MNKKDLQKLGLTDEFLEKSGLEPKILDDIIVLHGKDIESKKAEIASSAGEIDSLKSQLAEANVAIEDFKKLDPEGIQKAADDWKAKAELHAAEADAAKKEAEQQIKQAKLDTALQASLKEMGVRDPSDVAHRLNREALVMDEKGNLVGLKEQVEPWKEEKPYLFVESEDTPQLVLGSKGTPSNMDGLERAMRQGAGLGDKSK